MSEKLGEILLRDGVVSQEQLQSALRGQTENGRSLGDNLVSVGAIASVDDIVWQLAAQINTQVVNLSEMELPPNIISLIPEEMAIKYGVVPVQKEERIIHVVIGDPKNVFVVDAIKFLTGCNVRVWMAPESQVKKAVEKYYITSVTTTGFDGILQDVEDSNLEIVQENAEDDAGADYNVMEAPLVRLVNKVLMDAVKIRASDIHIETYEKTVRVRYRLDGTLIEQTTLPYKLKGAVVSRLKIMANLDIAERRLPQDGRIKLSFGMKKIDLRVSVLPTIYGEKVVMRILDQSNLNLDMSKMGFSAKSLQDFQESLNSPFGMILVTGPTGSGKSTTLYSALSSVNTPDTNIMTAEDPVEYNLEGINQVAVNGEIGLTFAAALKSFLRQDPDIIMVGEIRDLETAQIATKAALTGHLVLSTLHTNDAPSTITRLADMGIEPFLIATSLRLVIAQRLVRRICKECKAEDHPSTEELRLLEISDQEAKTIKFFKGAGCTVCAQTGFKGRVAIHQVLVVTDAIRKLIVDRATPDEIEKVSIAEGVLNLRMNALEKLKAGITTAQEVIWDEWADENGDLGPVYGKQWRSWSAGSGGQGADGVEVDQVKELIHTLKTSPDSRRMIISAWNVADLPKMKLMPCHCLFQFYVANGKLSCQLYQRSADVFLGVPFNIASYALLTMMIAQVCGLEPGEFVHSFGDVHLYSNHFEQANLQLTRTPFPLPQMKINPAVKDIFDFKFEDFELLNYQSHPAIKAPVAV